MSDIKTEPSKGFGNTMLISTIFLTLLLPLFFIMITYLKIIDGIQLGYFITAFAVVASSLFIVVGGLWMFIQDKQDGLLEDQKDHTPTVTSKKGN